jgi:cyclic pyranopterin phosphate synthase
MSEEMTFLPREQLLTLEEMGRIARCFAELGVAKIRITGGEPLTRRNIISLFQEIGSQPDLSELTITTNGTLLPEYAAPLKQAGVKRVNISLDTLQADRFKAITRTGHIEKTLAGIDAAVAAGFQRIKLNAVILKNRNHDEVVDLVNFAIDRGIDISFIEEMPLGQIDEHDRAEAYYSSQQIISDLSNHFDLHASTQSTGGPSRYFNLDGFDTRVGLISPHSHNFCDTCNRVRLTAEGRLLLCLGQEHSVDLRKVVRANPLDDEPLKKAIIDSMEIKPKGHEFELTSQDVLFRHMNVTGG